VLAQLLAVVALALVAWFTFAEVARMLRARRARPPEDAPDPAPLGVLCANPLVDELPSPVAGLRWARVEGRYALAAIRALDAIGEAQGWCPVYVGARRREWPLADGREAVSPESILAAAEHVDVARFFTEREAAASGDDDAEMLGDWPARPPFRADAFVVQTDVSRKPNDVLYLALVPAEAAWQVPAWIQNGGWNEVPTAEEQVAVLRHWHERHGARLRVFTADTMEFEVARPPQGRIASLALAREHFAFCSDIVHQGVGALRPLAHDLDGGRRWFFWWD
jgi:hypothetical protein